MPYADGSCPSATAACFARLSSWKLSQTVLSRATVYQPKMSPPSDVCWNEFSRKKLLVVVKKALRTCSGVHGWLGALRKFTSSTAARSAPNVFGIAAGALVCVVDDEVVPPEYAIKVPSTCTPCTRMRAWLASPGGGPSGNCSERR